MKVNCATYSLIVFIYSNIGMKMAKEDSEVIKETFHSSFYKLGRFTLSDELGNRNFNRE